MNHCIDCLHWDEDRADENGMADCSNTEVARSRMGNLRLYALPGDAVMMTRGDDGCALFAPNTAIASSSIKP